jgi:hypothetical protein
MRDKGWGVGITAALVILALVLVLPRVKGTTGVVVAILAVLAVGVLGWYVAAARSQGGNGG